MRVKRPGFHSRVKQKNSLQLISCNKSLPPREGRFAGKRTFQFTRAAKGGAPVPVRRSSRFMIYYEMTSSNYLGLYCAEKNCKKEFFPFSLLF